MTVQIQSYQDAPQGSGSLLGIFNVYLPNIQLLIRFVKLFKGKHGHFISIPSRMVEEGGKRNSIPYVEFSLEKQKRLNAMILEALEPYIVSTTSVPAREDLFDRPITDEDCPF